MKNVLKIFLLAVIMISSNLVQAQGHDRETLRNAMDRTNDVIQQAMEIVGRSNSERAKALLNTAISLQKRAYSLAETSFNVDSTFKALQAAKYTLSAREKAQQSIVVARQSVENEDYIRMRLERTNELLERAEEKVGPDAPENIKLLMDSAREKQQQAMELFRNRRFKMSLQLTMQVEKSLERMIDEAGGYLKAKQRFESLQERYYTLKDRIESSQYNNRNQIQRQMDRADKIRQEAESMAAEKAYIRAEAAMQNAVKILLKIAEQIREPGKIKQALENLTRQSSLLEDRVNESGDRHLERMFQSANEHLAKASSYYQESSYEAATTQLQAARQLINQIKKLIENKG